MAVTKKKWSILSRDILIQELFVMALIQGQEWLRIKEGMQEVL